MSIFHCGHVSRKWQFAQAYEDIVLAAKKLSGIVCQNLFIKFFFFMYSGEACWACMLFFHQHPGSWPAFSSWLLSVWFFHHSCPGVYSQSEGFQFCSKCLLVLFFLLWVCCFFMCFVWFFTNLIYRSMTTQVVTESCLWRSEYTKPNFNSKSHFLLLESTLYSHSLIMPTVALFHFYDFKPFRF